MSPHRAGFVFLDLAGAMVGLALLGTLVVAAYAGVRQLRQVESASARLEEAQNLLARWRAGEAVTAPGWTAIVVAGAGSERLELRGYGVRLATLRPLAGGGR